MFGFIMGHSKAFTEKSKSTVHTKKVCKVCNKDIEKIRVNGRGTYYCKYCQK